jgi:hypothetical protein
MTRDDIIRMAQRVGMSGMLTDVVTNIDELERFAYLVAAASASVEREAIEQRVLKSDMTMANRLYVVNDLIRAREQS